jgi:chemotaxis protein CheC
MENKFQQINEQAATHASRALSKLIGRTVEVGIRKTKIKKIEELSPLIGIEDVVAGIYLPVTGDTKGAALLIFPQETAFILSDLLAKRPAGTTRKLTELDESALKEVGNIISGNYLTVLANTLHIKVIEHLPFFSFDMFGAIISQVITEFAQKAEKALVVEIEFTFKPETLQGYFLLLFSVEQFSAILNDIEADSLVR